MKTVSGTKISTDDSFRFRDADTYEKKDGKPTRRRDGYVSDAERKAIESRLISKDSLGPLAVQEFGEPRPYYEHTVRVAGFDVTYRAASAGPDKVRRGEFEAMISRSADRLFALAYGIRE